MPLITLGDDTELKLKIPSKGDIDWSDDFKTQFAQKIVDHDHTGLDGKGKKLTGDSLADGAINRASLLGINLEDLPNVTDAPSNGHTLVYNEGQSRWNSQPPTSDIEIADTTVSIPTGGYASGIVVLTSDIDNYPNPDPNDADYATRLANRYILNFTNNGSASITDYSGVTFIIEDPLPSNKVAKFPDLISCTIVSNVDIEFHGKVENCKVLVRRPNGTAKTSLLSNGKFEGSVCDLDELVSAGHSSSITRFVQSHIKADILETQMTGTDVEIFNKSILQVGNLLNNPALVTGAVRLQLTDKSELDFKSHADIALDGTTINLSADSKLTTLSDIGSSNSQIVKAWDDTANRWQYLVSPSGINKLITADSSGVPVELSVSDGHVVKGSSSGLVSQDNSLINLNDVFNSGSPATNQFLYYTGSQWNGTTILQVPSGGSTGQILTKTSSGYTWQTQTEKSFVKIKDTFTWDSETTTRNHTIGSDEYAEVTIIRKAATASNANGLHMDNGGEGPIKTTFGPGVLQLHIPTSYGSTASLYHDSILYHVEGNQFFNRVGIAIHVVVFQNS